MDPYADDDSMSDLIAPAGESSGSSVSTDDEYTIEVYSDDEMKPEATEQSEGQPRPDVEDEVHDDAWEWAHGENEPWKQNEIDVDTLPDSCQEYIFERNNAPGYRLGLPVDDDPSIAWLKKQCNKDMETAGSSHIDTPAQDKTEYQVTPIAVKVIEVTSVATPAVSGYDSSGGSTKYFEFRKPGGGTTETKKIDPVATGNSGTLPELSYGWNGGGNQKAKPKKRKHKSRGGQTWSKQLKKKPEYTVSSASRVSQVEIDETDKEPKIRSSVDDQGYLDPDEVPDQVSETRVYRFQNGRVVAVNQ
ncbi:hypothetical protein HDE_05707 [Halotydeus destructor]|nr:hypothetical protein HDE_05707 [Halotydeus destructor]